MTRRSRRLRTTDRLIASLDVIDYELDRMGIATEATDVAPDERSTMRRDVRYLARRTAKFIERLSKRLDEKKA